MLPEASSAVVIDPSEKSTSQIIDDFIQAIKGNVDANLATQKKTIEEFFKSDKSSNITSRDVIHIIKEAVNDNGLIKGKIIREFFDSNTSSEITSRDVVEIIKEARFGDDHSKVSMMSSFLESPKSFAITIDDVIKMIEETGIGDDGLKASVMSSFLKSPKSSAITSDDVIKMIEETGIGDETRKMFIIHDFIKSDKSPAITSDDVIKMIKETGIGDEDVKMLIIQDFINNKEITSGDVIKMIKETGIGDDLAKGSIIQEFLKSPKSSAITSDDVIKMIKETGIGDDEVKASIIQEFLKSDRSPTMTTQELANMIKGVGLENQADYSIQLCEAKFSSSPNYLQNFIDLTKAIQPSEAMQCQFVKEFIENFIDYFSVSENLVPVLGIFIEGLKDNELALDLIKNLCDVGEINDEKDILKLVKNRSKKQYAFLTEIVGDKTLIECISEGGLSDLKATFGTDDLMIDGNPISVSDLISYYDLINQTPSLFAMLKPEFKQQLRDNFSPSAKILLYKPAELEKLNSLLSEEGVAFDVKSYFVENTKLCDYLKEKVGNVKEIDSSTTYKINFANFVIEEEEKKAGIDTLFNELLKSHDTNEEGVVKFFEEMLGVTLSEFSEQKKEDLKAFFLSNKKELAHCFCNENLPKENFTSLLTTLRDGCFANIGAQFKKMLYATMIKDEEAQILYAVADDKIFSGIINNHGHDIMIGDFSPINDRIINSYSLSPMALVTKLSEEEMLTNEKSWEIIGKNAGEDKKNEILEKLSDSYPDIEIFDKKAKEIASFLIIKTVVGEDKMTDLENKNPQLKELGNLIYDRAPEPSPGTKRAASSEELSGPPTKRSRA